MRTFALVLLLAIAGAAAFSGVGALALYAVVGAAWAFCAVPWGERVYFASRFVQPTQSLWLATLVGVLTRALLAVVFWPLEMFAAAAAERRAER